MWRKLYLITYKLHLNSQNINSVKLSLPEAWALTNTNDFSCALFPAYATSVSHVSNLASQNACCHVEAGKCSNKFEMYQSQHNIFNILLLDLAQKIASMLRGLYMYVLFMMCVTVVSYSCVSMLFQKWRLTPLH